MYELNDKQVEGVSGGLAQFLIGYAASKVIDYTISSIVDFGHEYATKDFTESNAAFDPSGSPGFGTI